MFVHFVHLREGTSLNFHLASHDRCEVKLKPNLWDAGPYFLPKLLDDGALHVVPHSTTKHQGTQTPQNRAAAQLEPVGRSHSAPQPLPGTIVDAQTCMAKDDSTAPKSRKQRTNFEEERKGYNQHSHLPKHLVTTGPQPLPINLSGKTWLEAHTKARQRWIDTNHPGQIVKKGDSRYIHASRHAHKGLLEGEYGTSTLSSCDRCAPLGLECRIYYPECYECEKEGHSIVSDLGWRCNNCRLAEVCVFSKDDVSTSREVPPETNDDPQLVLQKGIISIQDNSNSPQGRNQYSLQLQNKLPAHLRSIPPLPTLITRDAWKIDLDNARQKLIDERCIGYAQKRNERHIVNLFAHQALIHGKYGVRAAMTCESCSDQERECRTYHPGCYQRHFQGDSGAIEHLGWRCGNCRYQTDKSYWTGCNVQWE